LRKIAEAIGWGGVSLIAKATGLSRTTITAAIKELSKLKRMELQNNSKANIICSGYLWTITKY
jgi:DNA-binding MarR family transcriptional regulator